MYYVNLLMTIPSATLPRCWAVRVTRSETQGFVVHWHLIYERRSCSSKLSCSSVGMKERAVHTAGSRGSLAALQALRSDRGDGKIWRMSKPSTSFKNSLPRRRKREREKKNVCVCARICVYIHAQVDSRVESPCLLWFRSYRAKRFSLFLSPSPFFLCFFPIWWRQNGPYFCIPSLQSIGAQPYGIWFLRSVQDRGILIRLARKCRDTYMLECLRSRELYERIVIHRYRY